MSGYIKYQVYPTATDFYDKTKEFSIYTKQTQPKLELRSAAYVDENLTNIYKNDFIHEGVHYIISGYGYIIGMHLIPVNKPVTKYVAPKQQTQHVPPPTPYRYVYTETIPEHLKCVNKNSPYPDTDKGKQQFKKDLKSKITNVKESENKKVKTGKNLLYYSIFDKDSGYINLLRESLLSIKKFEPLNFDLLLITDDITKPKLDAILTEIDITYHFLLVDTPISGINASKAKTKIYQFDKINDYENILFLDSDTLIVKNIDIVFEIAKKYEILYTAFNSNLSLDIHKRSLYHGLQSYDDCEIDEMVYHNQMPFNAGQFLFKNSSHMRGHFENLNWFMENWPSVYFFEQSFMNHYFCGNIMTEWEEFNPIFFLAMNHINDMYGPDVVVIHFIGPALDLEAKLAHIEKYKKLNSL